MLLTLLLIIWIIIQDKTVCDNSKWNRLKDE